MNSLKRIKSALVSVYNKDNLDEIVKKLDELGVTIYSTGGTKSFIEGKNIPVTAVEDLSTYPSILGGRVKTLHPKVFGGILARRSNEDDIACLEQYEIPEIDLVIVGLYPFEATVASGASVKDIIEKIDIGGIALIRGAAKNFNDVIVVSSRGQYSDLMSLLDKKNGETSLDDRRRYAIEAFAVTSNYDTAIFNYFSDKDNSKFRKSFDSSKQLRYGENPHQKGVFFGQFDEMFTQLHGKEISYNNILDIDAAVSLVDEFNETSIAILKHNNACGCASRESLVEAWKAALAADPVSAFGGIIIANREIDTATAEEADKLFFEAIIAPGYDPEALKILKKKKNRIILARKDTELPSAQYRSALNGVLVQERDLKFEVSEELTPVTKVIPTSQQVDDLLFANKLVRQSKSNAIVLAKGKQMISSGVGQTSRVDALRHAIAKAKSFGFELNGAVMASDAFFPFPDCVEIAGNAGIKCIIQPGGSIRDKDSVSYCDNNGIAMVTTGFRHFKH